MSVASKRRYMMNKLDYEMYTPVEGDSIAQVVAARGNNLHEIIDEQGETYLVSMPSKFRKAVWIRKGQFIVVRPIEEGSKVRAEIEHVLDAENVLQIRKEGKWPERFETEAKLLTRGVKNNGGVLAKDENTEGASGGGDQRLTKSIIDEDMLPPSGSEDESDEGDDEDEDEDEVESGEEVPGEIDEDEEEDEEDDEPITYNPNRSQAPGDRRRET